MHSDMDDAQLPAVKCLIAVCTETRPVKELKGFTKVQLSPGETRHVSVKLDRRAFAYYNLKNHGWAVDAGEFNVYVGSSSARIELTGTITRDAD